MKSLLFGGVAAVTMGLSAALAQTAADPAKTPAAAPAASAATSATPSAEVVSAQPDGTMRAPKLIGVAVYDRDNKDVGKIADLLLDHDGKVQAVVIGVGGFLGIGSKDIAVNYSALHWKTDPRQVATNGPAPGSAAGGNAGTTMTPAEKPATKTVDPAKTEAYQGYPDRATIDMTEAELKSAPEFKYATAPTESTTPGAPATPASKS
jgi:sporulation protein YlmC with PRC-barrel domain